MSVDCLENKHRYSAEYLSQSRNDVLELIPAGCKRILDVGCGYGGLGRLIKTSMEVELLFGIEKSTTAEEYLKGVYDQFHICDVEEFAFTDVDVRFDCIIFADIIEHLVNPWQAIAYFSRFLEKQGKLVLSIPNIRNIVIISELLINGRWQYNKSGILDVGHLRFFTLREIQRMLGQIGFKIQFLRKNRDHYSFLKRMLVALPLLLIPDLSVCQYLIRAERF